MVRGTKRAAQKVAASLTVESPAPEGNRAVAEALDAWLEVSGRLRNKSLRTYAHAIDGADAGVAATLAESLDGKT